MVKSTFLVRQATIAASIPANNRVLLTDRSNLFPYRNNAGKMIAERTATGTKRNVLWRNGGISRLPKSVINERRIAKVNNPMHMSVSQSASGVIIPPPFLRVLSWYPLTARQRNVFDRRHLLSYESLCVCYTSTPEIYQYLCLRTKQRSGPTCRVS